MCSRPSGEVVTDPDEQVRAVVALIFDLFDELGTLNAVLAYLAGHGIGDRGPAAGRPGRR